MSLRPDNDHDAMLRRLVNTTAPGLLIGVLKGEILAAWMALDMARSYRKDALRYRWLRERPSFIGWDWWEPKVPNDVLITPEFMDAAIDEKLDMNEGRS